MYFITKLALRNLTQKKTRAILTIIGIALGVALILAVNATKGIIVDNYVSLMSDLSGASDLQVNGPSQVGLEESVLEKVRLVKGIKQAMPTISKKGFLLKEGKKEIQVLGIDASKDREFRNYKIKEGEFLPKAADLKSLLLTQEWAKDNHLKIGDIVKIGTADGIKSLIIVGFLAKTGPAQTFGGRVGIIPLRVAQEFYKLKGKVTDIDIKVVAGTDIGKVQKALRKKLGDGFVVERPIMKGKTVETSTKGLIDTLGSFAILALLIGAFIVFNSMIANVFERKTEIGILRLVGTTKKQIIYLVLAEAAFLGFLGSFLGVILGNSMSQFFPGTVGQALRLPVTKITFSFRIIIFSFSTGVVVSIIAALIPALRACRTSPVAATKIETGQSISGWTGKIVIITGSGLMIASLASFFIHLKGQSVLAINLAITLFLLALSLFSIILLPLLSYIFKPLFVTLFYPEGRLAERNINRARIRNGLAVITILISITMVITASEIKISYSDLVKKFLDSNMPLDLYVRNPIPFGPADVGKYPSVNLKLRDKIKNVKGVAAVDAFKFLSVKGLGRDIFVIFCEPDRAQRMWWKYVFDQGEPNQARKDLAKGDAAWISTTISVKHNLRIGDYLKLKTVKGYRSFKVVGVVVEIANDGYSVHLSRKDLQRYYGINTADNFPIAIKHGASLSAVIKRLKKEIGKPYNLDVMSVKENKAQIYQALDKFISLLSILIIIAIFISVLGVTNIFTMNVLERIREIGVLRAVGSTRRQISRIILVEAGIIGSVGGLFGTVGGLVISRAIITVTNVTSGFPAKYIFPTGYLIFGFFVAICVSIISALYPSYKAVKIDIVKAFRYE